MRPIKDQCVDTHRPRFTDCLTRCGCSTGRIVILTEPLVTMMRDGSGERRATGNISEVSQGGNLDRCLISFPISRKPDMIRCHSSLT